MPSKKEMPSSKSKSTVSPDLNKLSSEGALALSMYAGDVLLVLDDWIKILVKQVDGQRVRMIILAPKEISVKRITVTDYNKTHGA